MIDKLKIEENIREILIALGEDPNREGLKETPKRVANMYCEIFKGIEYTNDDIAHQFSKTFTNDSRTYKKNDIILMKDIDAFSVCEHHMALIYNMNIAIAYIPREKIIGLSKIVRVVDMVTRRLQLQERIGQDIAYIIEKITESPDVAVIIEAEHSCITMRGIKKNGMKTITTNYQGKFDSNPILQQRLMNMYKN